jgi:actin-related protein
MWVLLAGGGLLVLGVSMKILKPSWFGGNDSPAYAGEVDELHLQESRLWARAVRAEKEARRLRSENQGDRDRAYYAELLVEQIAEERDKLKEELAQAKRHLADPGAYHLSAVASK